MARGDEDMRQPRQCANGGQAVRQAGPRAHPSRALVQPCRGEHAPRLLLQNRGGPPGRRIIRQAQLFSAGYALAHPHRGDGDMQFELTHYVVQPDAGIGKGHVV